MSKKLQFENIITGSDLEKITEIEGLNQDNQVQYELEYDTLSDKEMKLIQDNRKKLWRQQEYKQQLKQFIKQAYNKDKEEITNGFALKVYKKMYEVNIKNNHQLKPYQKILYHPDLTIQDYNFIVDSDRKGKMNVLKTQVALFVGFGIAYASIRGFNSMIKQNLKYSIPVLSAAPLVIMWGGYKLQDYSLSRKVEQSGLVTRYLSDVNNDPYKNPHLNKRMV